LKKSERQRSLGHELIFRKARHDSTPRLTGFAIAVLIALVILVLALGALLFSLREPEAPLAHSAAATSVLTAENDKSTKQGKGDAITASESPKPADGRPVVNSATHSSSQTATTLPLPASPKLVKPANMPHSPAPAQNSEEAPWLSSLPQSFRSSLPPLAVNIHVYSPDRTQRILYINNRPVKQGDRIEGGVLVVEIVHNGVVLQYRERRFKLPRPN
jgi:hypothetical protein